jgi:formate dehydrogenase subunit delta
MSHSEFDDAEHIETTSDERLIYMANQIAKFFASQKHDKAVEGCRNHIAKFWDPRMRQHIRDHVAAGGAGLEPLAKEAVAGLTR